VANLIVRCAIVIAALSPIWRRLYIEHFWVRGRATVIQVDRELVRGGEVSGWVWVPTIEYYADGQRWAFPKSYLQPAASFFGGPDSKYRVGDQVDILYNPRKPRCCTFDGWSHWILVATFTGALGIFAVVNLPEH
jgi:hypothetical protein